MKRNRKIIKCLLVFKYIKIFVIFFRFEGFGGGLLLIHFGGGRFGSEDITPLPVISQSA